MGTAHAGKGAYKQHTYLQVVQLHRVYAAVNGEHSRCRIWGACGRGGARRTRMRKEGSHLVGLYCCRRHHDSQLWPLPEHLHTAARARSRVGA